MQLVIILNGFNYQKYYMNCVLPWAYLEQMKPILELQLMVKYLPPNPNHVQSLVPSGSAGSPCQFLKIVSNAKLEKTNFSKNICDNVDS